MTTGKERWAARWRRMTGPRVRDVAVVVVAALYAPFPAFQTWEGFSGPVVIGLWVLLAASVVALWWRRRFPVLVVLITGALALLAGHALAAGLALATLAVRRRDRVLVLCWAYVALCLSGLRELGPNWSAQNLISGAVLALLAALLGAYVGARRDLLASLRDRAERAEQERELRADQARSAERARIAREMHDVLAHKVSLIALQAGALEVNPDRGPAEVERSAALIRSTARGTLEDLRGVLGVLRSDDAGAPLAPQPTLSDLDQLVAGSRAAGVTVLLAMHADPAQVPETVQRTAYRIVQEALTNVHKHARGARTQITVGPADQGLAVDVRNERPVAAGSLLPGSGSGLHGLAERVALAGGTLAAGPTPDGGWRVSAVLPLIEHASGRVSA
jgi:signal transduction histidine kinase